jgi:mycothiol system anti-sigma-R factor
MSCDIPKAQLYLYLDRELAPPEALTVEHHLETCDACQREAASHQHLQILLRRALTQEEAPEQLWTSIQRRLPKEPQNMVHHSRRFARKRLAVALTAVAALLVLAFSIRVWFASPVSVVVQEIVDSQIRSQLMGTSYKKVSAEPEAIRQWFHDKVAFSVLVPKVPKDQYAFLGVRLNYFLNRRVAEISYTSPSHMLSFMMFSDKDITLKSLRTVSAGNRVFYVQQYKGYRTVLWKDGDLFCSLVSDLPLTTLLRMAHDATESSPAS